MRGFNRMAGRARWLIATMALPTLAVAVGSGAAPATDESSADKQYAELGEIIVTAQRTQSAESKTPISMDAIGGEDLTRQGLITVADLNGYAQNLNVQENYSGVQFTIRGVTTNFYRLPNTANPIYNIQNPIYFEAGTTEQLSTNAFQQYWQYGTSAQTWGISPQLDWVMGPLQMTYLSSFREQHEHYIYGAPLTATYAMPNIYVSSDQTSSQELRFATTAAGPLQAQFGLYYFREALYDNWSIYDFPQVLHFGYLAVGSDPQINKSWAGFAQATYSVLPPLRLTLGLRESHDEKNYFSQSVRNLLPFSDPATNVVTPSFATLKSSKLTWRAGVEYDATEHTMLYGTVSTGYKAGGVNSGCLQGTSHNGIQCSGLLALPASVLFYQPETITSYEAGIKSRLAGGRIYVTADAFHYNYNNLQLETVQQVAGLYIQATENASKASVNGVELNGIWQADTHNEFDLGLTYLNARYGDYFPLGEGNPPNYNGRTLDDSPQYTVNLGYTYRQPLSIGGDIELSAHSYFSGSYLLSVVTIPTQYRQPPYHMTDVNATYRFSGDKWYLQAYAKNLENKIIVVNVNTNAAVPGAPRTFGLRVGFYFQ